MDIMTSSVTSVQGYDYALVITDDTTVISTMYRYGIRVEDERRSKGHDPQMDSRHS
jgi:hypothetical protein